MGVELDAAMVVPDARYATADAVVEAVRRVVAGDLFLEPGKGAGDSATGALTVRGSVTGVRSFAASTRGEAV